MASSRSRITQLDGLRAIAITAVFAHHLFTLKLMWMGVDLFFVLSGFLITGILYNEKRKSFADYIGSFYTRRARRILPAYVVVLILTGIVFGFGFLRFWYIYFGAMNFAIPLGIHIPETLPLWSLAVEEQFYLLWPVAVFFLNRRQLIWCASGMLVAAPLLRFLCTPLFPWHWEIYMLLPFRMDTLAAGALIALLWPRLEAHLGHSARRRLHWQIAAGCGCAVVAALGCLKWLGRHGVETTTNSRLGNTVIYDAVLVLVTSLFMVVLLGFGKRLLSTWPMLWIGRISYSVYLIHLTAIALLMRFGWPVVVAASLLYSLAMWFLVEDPINRLGHVRPKVLVTQ